MGKLRLATTGAIVITVFASLLAPIARASDTEPIDLVYDVRHFGARGDGTTDDSRAIQRANDAASAAGGGIVHIPPGTYIAKLIQQDSDVTISGSRDAILMHPDGTSGPIITNRRAKTYGSIDAGSRTIRVTDPTGARTGGLIAIAGAGGPSSAQRTTLATGVGSGDQRVAFSSWVGWPAANHVVVGDEVMAYGTNSGSLRFFRGLLGTPAKPHPAGTEVSQLSQLYARVTDVTGDTVTIDRPAAFGVRGTTVTFGSDGHAVLGLTLDGNRPTGASTSSTMTAIEYHLARNARVAGTLIRNTEHGAISLDAGTRDSVIERNEIVDAGSPDVRRGASIWLFRGASGNTIRENTIGGNAFHGIFVDDRTNTSSAWDASADDNLIAGNTILAPASGNAGVLVVGSSRNVIHRNTIGGQTMGIRIERSMQGIGDHKDASSNAVSENALGPHGYGIYLTGSSNRVDRNRCSGCAREVVDSGDSNSIDEIDPAPTVLTVRRPKAGARMLRARLTSDGEGLAGREVTFRLRGRRICSATTDTSGRAVCRIGRVRPRQVIAASFAGDEESLAALTRTRVR